MKDPSPFFRLVIFGGHSVHLACRVHNSGRKPATSTIAERRRLTGCVQSDSGIFWRLLIQELLELNKYTARITTPCLISLSLLVQIYHLPQTQVWGKFEHKTWRFSGQRSTQIAIGMARRAEQTLSYSIDTRPKTVACFIGTTSWHCSRSHNEDVPMS